MSDSRDRLAYTALGRPLTDDGNAYRLVDEHGDSLRYVPGVGWYAWDGTRWLHDSSGEPMRRASATSSNSCGRRPSSGAATTAATTNSRQALLQRHQHACPRRGEASRRCSRSHAATAA